MELGRPGNTLNPLCIGGSHCSIGLCSQCRGMIYPHRCMMPLIDSFFFGGSHFCELTHFRCWRSVRRKRLRECRSFDSFFLLACRPAQTSPLLAFRPVEARAGVPSRAMRLTALCLKNIYENIHAALVVAITHSSTYSLFL